MKIICSKGIMNESDEKLVLISILGIIEALKNDSMSIDEAEKFLFSPYIVKKLQTRKCNNKIIDIIEKGCELEDIASLIPEELLNNIAELEQETLEIIKAYPNLNKTFWIDR